MGRSWGASAGRLLEAVLFTCALLVLPAGGSRAGTQTALAAIKAVDPQMAAKLEPVMRHDFSTPELGVRKGVVHMGANVRLRRVVNDLLKGAGAHIKVGVVGGSITWGTGVTMRGVNDWFSIFGAWLQEAFPGANVTSKNGCIPATPASYMVMCLQYSVDEDADLVFLEYILNDGFKENKVTHNHFTHVMERLFRRILGLPKHPALAFMQVLTHGQAFPESHRDWVPFHQTNEEIYGALAQYYDAGWLSLRDAVYRLARHKKDPRFDFIGNIMVEADMAHPSDGGHKVMAELAISMVQATALDLAFRPWGSVPGEEEMLVEPLPPPMQPGNYEPSTPLCMHQDDMKPLVLEAKGFTFVNEGSEIKPKKGYVATEAGAVLRIRVNTTRRHRQSRHEGGDDTGGAKGGGNVGVIIAYLKSYTNMGNAVITCQSGCTCDPKVVQAHHDAHESQTYLATVQATQSDTCELAVTVTADTPAGQRKFKVSGVMMTYGAADQDATNYNRDGVWESTGFYRWGDAIRRREL